jgi:hypothetical protein
LAGKAESRKNQRISVRWPISISMNDATVKGETLDISINGISFSCDEPIRLNRSYDMSINAPNRRVEVNGRAVWSDLYGIDDKDNALCMGICFLEISDENRHFIGEIISEHLK